mgnify:FL=1
MESLQLPERVKVQKEVLEAEALEQNKTERHKILSVQTRPNQSNHTRKAMLTHLAKLDLT